MGIISRLLNFIYEGTWTIGFTTTSPEDIIKGKSFSVNWIKHSNNSQWFADPFILSVNADNIEVLVEEYNDEIKKGRISKLQINRNTYVIEKISVVLQLDQHLSFPAILRRDGKIFIYPENCASGKLVLYEYQKEHERCLPVCTLVEEPLTDAILTDVFGSDVIFSTHLPIQNGNMLTQYVKDGETFVEKCNIRFSCNEARNAGDWFICNRKIYRPAQDCSISYGKAIVLQEVSCDYNGKYVFENVRTIESPHSSYKRGCHTFNFYAGYGVIDVFGYRRPLLARIGQFLHLSEVTSFLYSRLKIML